MRAKRPQIGSMQLSDAFAITFASRAHACALETEEGGVLVQRTFRSLEERAARVAGWLVARGFATGDRLAVLLPNCVEFLDLFLACARLGVIFVPINVLYKAREVAHIVGDSNPHALVTTLEHREHVPDSTPLILVDEVGAAALRHDLYAERRSLDGETPAALVYTSGTTGKSKGAILTHNNFLANGAGLTISWQITERDRYLATLPLFHVHGLGNGVIAWLLSGCTMRLTERFDITRAAEWFADFRPTLVFGVPTMYARLVELAPEVCRDIGSQMRLFVCGSAPLPAALLEAFRERFGHTILERYGMSETLMNLSNPLIGERRAGSVGFPLPGVSVRILDASGAPAPNDTVGQLYVRGPNVCAGYWEQPDATAASFVDGWFATGDLAERSADGYYTLRGRMSDLIISGGFNIYPREIEELLLEHPRVKEVAVVGAVHPTRGEVPVAYVVPHGALDADALDRLCRSQLASFKIPRAFIAVESLPRTALGKIQKHLLPPWSESHL